MMAATPPPAHTFPAHAYNMSALRQPVYHTQAPQVVPMAVTDERVAQMSRLEHPVTVGAQSGHYPSPPSIHPTSAAAPATPGSYSPPPMLAQQISNASRTTSTSDEQSEGNSTVASRPCLHNEWDDVRQHKGVKVLRCRVCDSVWRWARGVRRGDDGLRRCIDFLNNRCTNGTACPLLHVHRTKQSLEERIARFGEQVRTGVVREGGGWRRQPQRERLSSMQSDQSVLSLQSVQSVQSNRSGYAQPVAQGQVVQGQPIVQGQPVMQQAVQTQPIQPIPQATLQQQVPQSFQGGMMQPLAQPMQPLMGQVPMHMPVQEYVHQQYQQPMVQGYVSDPQYTAFPTAAPGGSPPSPGAYVSRPDIYAPLPTSPPSPCPYDYSNRL